MFCGCSGKKNSTSLFEFLKWSCLCQLAVKVVNRRHLKRTPFSPPFPVFKASSSGCCQSFWPNVARGVTTRVFLQNHQQFVSSLPNNQITCPHDFLKGKTLCVINRILVNHGFNRSLNLRNRRIEITNAATNSQIVRIIRAKSQIQK